MFVFGKHYAGGICEIYENDFHKNLAYLIMLGTTEDITVVDKSGTQCCGPALLIKPMVEHFIVKSPSLACSIFLAPNSAFAASLDGFASNKGIIKLPPDALPFHSGMSNDEIFSTIDKLIAESDAEIDPRLAAAIEALEDMSYQSSIADIVEQSELSASRLRALAKEQIGVPLSSLLLWRKLIKSMEVLASGCTLSEAAMAGGFSDQAHFSRTMRKMFGITPSNSTNALNY